MTRGTTPIHTFYLEDYNTDIISKIRILYAQNDKNILIKEEKDCDFEGNTITTKLTQEETYLFDDKQIVQIQLHILTTTNESLVSDIERIKVEKCLDTEVLV